MRGGPRLFNSAYVTGALGLMLLISGLSYWSTTSQNKFLTAKLLELQEDVKLEAKLVEDTEARCAKYQLHITEERDKYQFERNDCQKKFDLLEKENIYQVGQIDSLEDAKSKLLNNVEELKISNQETKLQEENIRLSESVDDLQKKLRDLETKLEDEELKSRDLQGKLAEILETNPHIAQAAGKRQQQPDLGEGQLPDINPAAVSVVKKDTLGGRVNKFDTLLTDENNNNQGHNGIQILPAAKNGPNFGAIPPPNTGRGGGVANSGNNVSPLPQIVSAGMMPNIKRGISSTSPIPKRAPAIVFEPSMDGEDLNKNENISFVDEHGEGALQENSGIADEENVEKILDAQIESLNNSKERRAVDQNKEELKEDKNQEEFQAVKTADDKLVFLDHHEADLNSTDHQKNDVIDEENVQKIMEAQVKSKELEGEESLINKVDNFNQVDEIEHGNKAIDDNIHDKENVIDDTDNFIVDKENVLDDTVNVIADSVNDIDDMKVNNVKAGGQSEENGFHDKLSNVIQI